MTREKPGFIPAAAITVVPLGSLIYAGIGFGFWVPLAIALMGWLAVFLIRRGRLRLGRWVWAAAGFAGLWLISSLVWIGVNSARSLEQTLPPDCDTIVVLGTGIEDGAPSERLRMRLYAAISAAEQYPDALVIPSGGFDAGETVSEAQAMAAFMEERGIRGDRIVIEPRSTSTYENLIYSRPLARGSDTVVVTSGFHTLRAGLWCRWMGWDAVTVGAPTPWPEGVHWWVRECLALWKDIVKYFFVT